MDYCYTIHVIAVNKKKKLSASFMLIYAGIYNSGSAMAALQYSMWLFRLAIQGKNDVCRVAVRDTETGDPARLPAQVPGQ